MAALCANGGERKLFGGTFGGILKDVIGKYLYISMYFYCLFCSYYRHHLNQVVTSHSITPHFPPVPYLCHCNPGNSSKYCSDIRQCRCRHLSQLLPPFLDVVNQGAELWCNIATLWEIQIEARKLWKKVIKQRYKLTAFNIWPESFLSGNCYACAGKSQPQHQTQIILLIPPMLRSGVVN